MKLTVEYLRELITSESEELSSSELRKELANMSEEEAFRLAIRLVPELNESYIPSLKKNSFVFTKLNNSFSWANGITYSEFQYLAETLCPGLLSSVLHNEDFPIEFIIDSNILRKRENDQFYSAVKTSIQYVCQERYGEIADYCRGIVPNSESMSDDMVIKIAKIEI